METTVTELINKLSTTPKPGNKHNLPAYLSLWEIMLNQNWGPDFHVLAYSEDFIKYLIQALINDNRIFIADQETGEIIFQMDPETGSTTIDEI